MSETMSQAERERDHWRAQAQRANDALHLCSLDCAEPCPHDEATDLAAVCDVVERVRVLHQRQHASVVDAVWGVDPRCDECGKSYPCPTLAVLDGAA